MPIKFTKQKFAEEVEQIVSKGATYLDAVQTVCEKNEIDLESARPYISSSLLEKITIEARDLNLLQKDKNEDMTAELPL